MNNMRLLKRKAVIRSEAVMQSALERLRVSHADFDFGNARIFRAVKSIVFVSRIFEHMST
jgi:hypothetical protein